MEPTFTYPTCKGLRGHAFISTNRDVVPTVANVLSPFGCPMLEQTAGCGYQRILGEILQGTPGGPLAAPGTHWHQWEVTVHCSILEIS